MQLRTMHKGQATIVQAINKKLQSKYVNTWRQQWLSYIYEGINTPWQYMDDAMVSRAKTQQTRNQTELTDEKKLYATIIIWQSVPTS